MVTSEYFDNLDNPEPSFSIDVENTVKFLLILGSSTIFDNSCMYTRILFIADEFNELVISEDFDNLANPEPSFAIDVENTDKFLLILGSSIIFDNPCIAERILVITDEFIDVIKLEDADNFENPAPSFPIDVENTEKFVLTLGSSIIFDNPFIDKLTLFITDGFIDVIKSEDADNFENAVPSFPIEDENTVKFLFMLGSSIIFDTSCTDERNLFITDGFIESIISEDLDNL